MKDLGDLSYFLGMEAHRISNGLNQRQSKYILDLFYRASMIGAKPYAAPSVSGTKLSSFEGSSLSETETITYRQLVGGLQYCTLTRPDLAYSVNQLFQFMHSLTTSHWIALKRVLRYLEGSVDHGLFYSKGKSQLNIYSDSDWARNPDNRCSTTGYDVFFGSCLVSWFARKQSVVSRSSIEAEYQTLSYATAEAYWIRMLLQELHLSLSTPPTIWCDDIGALSLVSNPIYHARTKYIEIDFHFIREKMLNKDIIIRFISTIDQIADVSTKGISTSRFTTLRDKLLVIPPPNSLRGAVGVNPHDSACKPESLADKDFPQ
ncbi:hypothetical protein F2P56_027014 [Juglans regia]|uniref:Secreted RxLR effector protein 161-like n=1 Tax=Juglans regia TaxID=51240 RepID=A0A833T361_JUGRE|nr:hypothetical protein F2P56_027014 [Juglans regia]